MKMSLRTFLREPLLHFLLIGMLIFIVDKAVHSETQNQKLIVLDKNTRSELIQKFTEKQGRLPDLDEIDNLIDAWVYEEVMYREAVALGLDKGDPMFRSRLELKMRSMLIDNAVVDPPTDEQLKQWLEKSRARYSAPRRFDFIQIKIGGDDETAETEATNLVKTMRNGAIVEDYAGQEMYYRDRTRENIIQVFGESFAKGLLDPGDDYWHAVHANDGWHVARVQHDKPAVEPDFQSLKPQLEADWQKDALKQKAQEAYQDILSTYDIRVEDKS